MNYCYYHHHMEYVGDRPHRICGECGHVYVTEASLVGHFLGEMGYRRTADEIMACPLCGHDW